LTAEKILTEGLLAQYWHHRYDAAPVRNNRSPMTRL
jgi:hypothetical protein